MKKILVGISLACAASVSMAAAVCTLGTASAVAASTNFATNGFTPKCSANTHVDYTQSTTAGAVGAVSQKGKSIFGGNSEGGAVASTGSCAATACTATEAGTAATNALASTSS